VPDTLPPSTVSGSVLAALAHLKVIPHLGMADCSPPA
jgi:hypothetical protein